MVEASQEPGPIDDRSSEDMERLISAMAAEHRKLIARLVAERGLEPHLVGCALMASSVRASLAQPEMVMAEVARLLRGMAAALDRGEQRLMVLAPGGNA